MGQRTNAVAPSTHYVFWLGKRYIGRATQVVTGGGSGYAVVINVIWHILYHKIA